MKSLVFMKHEALSKSRVVRERSSHSTLHEVSEMEPSQDGPEQLCQHLSHEPRSEPSLRLDSSASMGLPSHSTSPDRLSGQEGAVQPQRASEDADSQMDLQLPLPPPLKPQDPAAVSVGTPPEAPQLPAAAVPPLNTSIRMPFHGGKLRPLNIVMLVVGTRGDVQPFIGIGLKLQEYGHRVRLASHAVYREFITGFGLEFYPLGGDPKVLSEYVVKHRGILPGWDISEAVQQREQVRQILYSTYGACTLPDPLHPDKPMTADAIVANPPAYGHTHCAEKLNVPLHIVFTMPWTPTKVFPQPFARIDVDMKRTNSKAREVMNWLSYFAMEDLAWVGMAGMQKDFRCNVLGLKTWNKLTTSHSIYHSKVPITYIWIPSLVPRPTDWPSHCEVVGFVNVELHKLTSYTPPDELKAFLDSGPPPVYIGFGSLVVDDPDKLTDQFLAALKRTGLRAIIQRGWGGLGSGYGHGAKPSPPDILFIDSAPHDWLFQMSSAVVHHGGAGTTATGLMAGKPTFIVPFFGDQPFWGAACALAGVGPEPVPIDSLTTDSIVNALKELILPTTGPGTSYGSREWHCKHGRSHPPHHLQRVGLGTSACLDAICTSC
ncbi:sterol 3-beta-glucosyltransferase [Haematococcus lacustris]